MKKDTRSLATITEERIIEMIREKKLKPGDRLDNEYILAENLQVGRSTVREAIKSLESRNVVTIKRGAGTFVSKKEGLATDPLGISMMGLDEQMTLELLEVRLILEAESAQRAAHYATVDDVKKLEMLCKKMEALSKQHTDCSEEDIRFHGVIGECSGNRVISKLIPITYTSVSLTVEMTYNKLVEHSMMFHREIMKAIKRQDGIGARNAMISHLSENRLYIISEIERKKRLRGLEDGV